MREIEKVGYTQGIPASSGKKQSSADAAERAMHEEEVIKELVNDPKMQSIVKNDNIQNDIKFLLANPDKVESVNKFVDNLQKALEQRGVEDSYEKALYFTYHLLNP